MTPPHMAVWMLVEVRCRQCEQQRSVQVLQADVSGFCCTDCVPRTTEPLPAQLYLDGPDRLASLLRRVQLVYFPVPVLLSVVRGDSYGSDDRALPDLNLHIKVTRWVPDTHTGQLSRVDSLHQLPWLRGMTVAPHAVFAWLHGYALREVVLHELAEAFHVDGERVFDPHREDP